jgi:hypothetical protein
MHQAANKIASGERSAIRSKVRAAPEGSRRPCSHSCKVRTDTPSNLGDAPLAALGLANGLQQIFFKLRHFGIFGGLSFSHRLVLIKLRQAAQKRIR